MALKIRGLTIQIGGDTSGLQKSLGEVNSDLKTTQSQLRDVEKGLKLDPTNTELLAEKQRLLGQVVDETARKLEVLQQAEAELQKAGVDENSKQFQTLKGEIALVQSQLGNARQNLDEFTNSGKKGLEDLQKGFSSVSDAAGKVADKTKAASAAAAGVITGLAGAAYKAVTASDDLNTLAKQSGLTTEEIQKFRYASDIVDVSTEDIIGSIKKLRKNMDSSSADVTAAWERIGVSVRDADGNFRDSTTVFYEALEGLSQIENETERDIVAMTLFGKSADNLAGIIDDGGEALRQLGEQASASGAILSQDTLDSLNAVNDQIDTLKANASGVLAQTGAKAMEALLPIFDKVIEKIGALLEWVGELDSEQLNTILTIAAVVAAISPVAGIIGKITGAVSGFLTFMPKLQAAFSAVTSFAAANPWALVAAAVAAVVALIIANWDKLKPILEKMWDFVKGMINGFLGLINSLIGGINALIRGLNKINFSVPEWVPFMGGKSFGFNVPEIPSIPLLASGGVVSGGSAIVGEAGAEVLTVSGGKATVQPLTNNTTNVYNQLANRPIDLHIDLNGNEVARGLYNPLQDLSGLKGASRI